jgi:SHS2 domain-containing protein
VRPVETVTLSCTSFDPECLFTAWLNTLLAEADLRRMFFSRFSVEIEGLRLTGAARGERIDPTRHVPGIEVKGATFTELAVREEDSGWTAQCVVDV